MMLAVMGAMAAGTVDGRPIRLLTQTTASGLTVQIVGDTSAPLQASYTLEMSSGASGGKRSLQRGSARLEPGQQATLLTAHLGGIASTHWMSRLHVYLAGSEDNEFVEQAD